MFRHTASVCLFQQKAIGVYIRAGDHHKHAPCACLDPYSADPEIGHHQLQILACWIIHGRGLISIIFWNLIFSGIHLMSVFWKFWTPWNCQEIPSSLHFGTIQSGFFVLRDTPNHTSNPRGFMELCWGYIKPRLGIFLWRWVATSKAIVVHSSCNLCQGLSDTTMASKLRKKGTCIFEWSC